MKIIVGTIDNLVSTEYHLNDSTEKKRIKGGANSICDLTNDYNLRKERFCPLRPLLVVVRTFSRTFFFQNYVGNIIASHVPNYTLKKKFVPKKVTNFGSIVGDFFVLPTFPKSKYSFPFNG